ncbi:MAG: bacteriohemerythrin [Chromatiaceae bacterium]|jgi:hemerythrin|nr:bacteriohemerythrin [Chromatiaceae bacterium]
MEKIVWKPEYSVGVERLDRQHQRIIKVINTLIAKPGIFIRSASIADALSELTSYVSEHFLLEEQLLEENNYPNLIDHVKRHTEYGEQIANFYLKKIENNKNVPRQLLNYLSEWWVGHILHEDMKYKSFFKDKGIR